MPNDDRHDWTVKASSDPDTARDAWLPVEPATDGAFTVIDQATSAGLAPVLVEKRTFERVFARGAALPRVDSLLILPALEARDLIDSVKEV